MKLQVWTKQGTGFAAFVGADLMQGLQNRRSQVRVLSRLPDESPKPRAFFVPETRFGPNFAPESLRSKTRKDETEVWTRYGLGVGRPTMDRHGFSPQPAPVGMVRDAQ